MFAHDLDAIPGPFERVDASFNGCVLGREAESVESDGVEDVVALHSHIARAGIRGRHNVPVADVQVVGRRVGQHGQEVVLGPGWVFAGGV